MLVTFLLKKNRTNPTAPFFFVAVFFFYLDQEMLESVCVAKGRDPKTFIKGLKEKGQWHVEVY